MVCLVEVRRSVSWVRILCMTAGCASAAVTSACGASGPNSTVAPRVPANGGVASAGAVPTSPLPSSAARRISYAALGASETAGVGAHPLDHGYAYLVHDSLDGSVDAFADTGIPGATLAEAQQTELNRALAIHPTVCTMFFGVNDIRAGVALSDFTAALADSVATLRRTGANVLVIGIPSLSQLPALRYPSRSNLDEMTRDWNEAMRTVAARTGAAFLSLEQFSGEISSHPEYLSPDGLHPSNAGHQRLAEVILAALRSEHFV